MANGRSPSRKRDTGRDAGGFIALPWAVIDSAAYMSLSHASKALLVEVARQLRSDNNGSLLLSGRYLLTRGWKSNDVNQRAKGELIGAELVFETVKGSRPNKASWYAVTWRALDKIVGFDPGAERAFERGAYRKLDLLKVGHKNASLTPSAGVRRPLIAPADGVETLAAIPADGAIRPVLPHLSTPSAGDHLDIAISGARTEEDRAAGSVLSSGKAGAKSAAAKKTRARRPPPVPAECETTDCKRMTIGFRPLCSNCLKSQSAKSRPKKARAK